MALTTRTTGTLITATIWNDSVDYSNNLGAHKADGSTLDVWGATAKTIGPSTGDMKVSAVNSDQSNAWLRCDGRTVGNGSSGGTARANADMSGLFTVLWTNFTNTELAIQDSSGGASSRGASAAADFAANKRMPLPDLRGRVIAGMDNPGGGAANRITSAQADVNGGSTGTETHTLTTPEMPAHTHGPSGGGNFLITGGAVFTTSAGATNSITATTASTGGGGAHQNTQPTYFLNWFIYTGN
jgi:hypothetical protein